MTPIRIRVRLVNGFVVKDPWSPAIDGIIAAAFMREKLGDDFFTQREADMQPVEGLPLAVERHDGRWWYLASSPAQIGARGQDKRFFHRRFDDQHEAYLPPGIGRVLTAAGPYKSSRLYERRAICRGLEWHVIGNEPEIRRLLGTIDQIGGGRGRGYGQVSEWLYDAGDEAIARRRRPLPVEYAQVIGVTGRVMPWGVVPPGRIAAAICDCVMP